MRADTDVDRSTQGDQERRVPGGSSRPQASRRSPGAGNEVLRSSPERASAAGSPTTSTVNAGADHRGHSPKRCGRSAEMIMKVKEPIEPEWPRIRENQLHLHVLPLRRVRAPHQGARRFRRGRDRVRDGRAAHGELPLLTPMSEVAGRMAVQEGAKYLEKPQGGARSAPRVECPA